VGHRGWDHPARPWWVHRAANRRNRRWYRRDEKWGRRCVERCSKDGHSWDGVHRDPTVVRRRPSSVDGLRAAAGSGDPKD